MCNSTLLGSLQRPLLAALMFGLSIIPARADELYLKVDGLVCAFCAQGIHELAEEDPRIRWSQVDLDHGEVIMRLAEGIQMDESATQKMIHDAGYDLVGYWGTWQDTEANSRWLEGILGLLPSEPWTAYREEVAGETIVRVSMPLQDWPKWEALLVEDPSAPLPASTEVWAKVGNPPAIALRPKAEISQAVMAAGRSQGGAVLYLIIADEG